ncbi:ferredoxin--NADP reductase [Photobacterium phosphoreum]|uniref:ferredoxin--NADP reductase n=1 Tax=Photobacterium phosphoreum TaxID=659 RepID=UPI0007F9674C|nr:ferredoxin--NADP reductase [Photobacterium phosphoreum]MCD9479760.1 ferredoxin--NADP(+) reductase [Photobacterium phosphoreum]MCD9483847.1 ferredoxin--NADP(+) reductase [Photobacterium phosphoreum]OBU47079.1 ferredoxin--NADP(+) reductase [Photobacterium phosphoreum]PSU39508.1 ferredoxin--NADP reductase [Photobacterium phosphoreum]PSU64894.1 ferredoxin--NADP reductase [Photobacterium phosphoreum]
MADWIPAQVIANRHWNQDLFSLSLRANIEPFKAGQFTKLGIMIGDNLIQRAYSFVNSPQHTDIEIYATRVADGLLSPRLHALQEGDTVQISARASGFFTLDEVATSQHLWLFATGTAIGPYLSILGQKEVWHKYRKIILIHAVRYAADLSYQAEISALKQQYGDQLIVQPFVSREPAPLCLTGRIPLAIADGLLERHVGLSLSAEHSQVMLCGNPQMVRDTKAVLEAKGLAKNLRRKPGQITMEHYW